MVQLTMRDEAMLDWLSVVRMADQEAVRWALAALPDGRADQPVGVRRGNQWITRLVEEGLVQRAQPAFNDRSIIWATHQGIGRVAPNLYRQTTRHEIAVAAVSARYLARGYTWFRDRRPATVQDHQVDGVAVKGDIVELVEVELTAKTLGRYKLICNSHAERMTAGGITRGLPRHARGNAGGVKPGRQVHLPRPTLPPGDLVDVRRARPVGGTRSPTLGHDARAGARSR